MNTEIRALIDEIEKRGGQLLGVTTKLILWRDAKGEYVTHWWEVWASNEVELTHGHYFGAVESTATAYFKANC